MTLPDGQFTFSVGRLLGRGGLGEVHEIEVTGTNCKHPVGRKLAKKRLNERWREHPTMRERFEREIRAVRDMAHPAIVSLEGENLHAGDERFYVMPLYARSVRDVLRDAPQGLALPWVAQFVARLADALGYAHDRGFIHRDLKPENILLDEQAQPVIADWGLGYFVHKNSVVLQPLTHAGMGTEYYCSLEQWNTGKCTATGDIYSLGITMAELLSGRQAPLAFGVGSGITHDVVSGVQGASEMNAVIHAMTSLLEWRRPRSMAECASRLRRIRT